MQGFRSKLINFTAPIVKKSFVGQKGEIVEEVVFQSNDVAGILDQIWSVAKSLIVRKVRIENSVAFWDSKEKPDKKELDQFVSIKDVSWKKIHLPSSLDTYLLTKFNVKNDIQILVYIYGNEVDCKANFQIIQSLLTSDLILSSESKEENNVSRDEINFKLETNWENWCRFCGSRNGPMKFEATIDADYFFQVFY